MRRTPTLSMRDGVYIGALLISLGTTYGIFSNRLSSVEQKQDASQLRYEREVVPRSEHLQMNAVLEQRLQAIIDSQKQLDHQVESIQLKLDQLMQNKGGR